MHLDFCEENDITHSFYYGDDIFKKFVRASKRKNFGAVIEICYANIICQVCFFCIFFN